MKRPVLVGVAAVALAVPSGAGAIVWNLRTPDGSIYCRLDDPPARTFFRCVRTGDGRWAGFSGDPVRSGRARMSTGIEASYRVIRDRRAFVLIHGRSWTSSDASAITCWHFRSGVTCKAFEGLSFWLGRRNGYRVFRDKPGFKPHVRPLFRTSFGVRCGIELWTLEPSVPLFRCWRARDGREFTVSTQGRGSSKLWPKSQGFRPRDFDLLRRGETFAWRCRELEGAFADGCSATAGKPVFTCRDAGGRLTCRNRTHGGFWVTARTFGVL